MKWARRRPTTSSVLAITFVFLILLTRAGWQSFVKFEELRGTAESTLAYAANHLADDTRTSEVEAKLDRLIATLTGEPSLARMNQRASQLLTQVQSKKRARNGYRQFIERHDDALFQDTQLTGLDPVENIRVIRQSTRTALEVLAADGCRDDTWKLAPWSSWLTEAELQDVGLGYYEMLLVLAEAVSQPLPGESAAEQADKAIRILGCANTLHRPTQAYHLRLAACLERGAIGREQGASSRRPRRSSLTALSTISSAVENVSSEAC